MRNYLKNSLSAGGAKVTIAQSGILFLLKQRTGRSMTELSQLMELDNSTITGLIDRLEKAGFVYRNPDPVDRRLSHVYITPMGLDEVNKAKVVIRKVNEEVKEGFTAEQVDAFKSVLQSFSQKFNSKSPSR